MHHSFFICIINYFNGAGYGHLSLLRGDPHWFVKKCLLHVGFLYSFFFFFYVHIYFILIFHLFSGLALQCQNCTVLLHTKNIWPCLAKDMEPTRWCYKQGNLVNLKAVIIFFSRYRSPRNSIMDVNEHVKYVNVNYY